MKNMNNWNRMPDALKEQVFSHLDRLAAKANLSESDRLAYDKAVDRYNVSRIVENDIWEKGLKEGKKETALEMKNDGLPFATIAKYTGLSIKEIEQL